MLWDGMMMRGERGGEAATKRVCGESRIDMDDKEKEDIPD